MLQILSILLPALALLLLSACRKYSNSPTNVLPLETHEGLGTMGCMVNGKLFIPQHSGWVNKPFSVATLDGYPGQNLNMDWTDDADDGLRIVTISLDSVYLQKGITFDLGVRPPDSALTPGSTGHSQFARYTNFGKTSGYIGQAIYNTTSLVKGQVTIDWYIPTAYIVAGTFWFDAINATGDTVHVRDGRFDMGYTQ